MKVVLITPGFPPTHGGVEEHTGRLVTELTRAGIEVEVLTADRTAAKATTERRPGLVIRRFPAWRSRHFSLSPRLLLAGLRAGQDADLVHVHSYHASTGIAMLGRNGTPLVFTPHYHGTGHTRLAVAMHRGYRFVGATLFRAARAVICVSQAEKAAVISDFPTAERRAFVIPNGVTTEKISTATPFADQPSTVLSLGRLEPYKGVAPLLRAMVMVQAPARLVVIGDGSQRSDLESLATELGIANRVEFLGAADTESVHRWLRTARVLVSLSEHEAFGMAPLEAACAGARVVLRDIPAYREIASDFLGDVATIVSGSPTETAAAINAALNAAPAANAQVPDWSLVAAETIRVYQEVLAGSALKQHGPSSTPGISVRSKVGSQ